MKYFSINTKFLREKIGLSQQEVATALGISRSTWTGYESGLSQPNITGLLKIVEFFDINSSDLLEKDLSNVNLNENKGVEKEANNVNHNVKVRVNPKAKKANNESCPDCAVKDSFIAVNQQLLEAKKQIIDSQDARIKLLENQIEQMKYDIAEKARNQQPEQEKKKTA